jgi:hypothetical protein
MDDTRRPAADPAAAEGRGALDGPVPGTVRTSTSPDIITSEKVLGFHDFWRSRGRGGGALPTRADMDPTAMPGFLSGIILTKVHRDPLDFEYRIIGEEVIARLGNLAGRRVRQAALINVTSSAYQSYCAAVETRLPQFLEGMTVTALKPDRPYRMSRVHCPLASPDGTAVDYVISYVSFL